MSGLFGDSDNGSSADVLPGELKDLLDSLEQNYWVPLLKTPFRALETICDGAQEKCPELYKPLAAFTTNLKAATDLLEFPYLLITPYAIRDSDVLIKIRECIKENPSWLTNGIIDQQLAVDMTKVLLKAGLSRFVERKEMMRVMHQACLLIWSAFEVFCKDIFVSVLNKSPSLYANLVNCQWTKERFGVSQNSWVKLLETHKYDLNGKLGSIVGSDKDFSSPQLLMEIFEVLFKDFDDSQKHLNSFKDSGIWLLGQRRHLIAHRCGIVDQEYLDKTRDASQVLGNVLQLRGKDLSVGMTAVAQCALGLAAIASRCWET